MSNILYVSDGDYGDVTGQMLSLVQGQYGQVVPIEVRDLAENVVNLTGYTITGHKRKGNTVTAIIGTLALSATPTAAPQINWTIDEDDTGDGGQFYLYLEMTNGSQVLKTHPVSLLITRDPAVNATPAAGMVSLTPAQKAFLVAIQGLTGLVRITSGAASGILIKTDGTTAPGVNDDSGDGYTIGSLWVDTTNDNIYMATDVTVGAANWEQINGGGAAWGAITGTLTDQTDLTSYLENYLFDITSVTGNTSGNYARVQSGDAPKRFEERTPAQVLADIGAQASSAKLSAIEALTWAANSIILLTGAATASVQALASHVITFLQSATAADARTAIGAGTGNGDAVKASANTFTRGQVIDGTVDEIQLLVQGHSTQTSRIQEWQNSAAATKSYVSNDGSWQIGPSVTAGGATGSVGAVYFFNTSVGLRRGGASELVLFAGTGGADQMTIRNNQVGIGTSAPAGRLHSYDTGGGFLHVYKSGVVGSATAVIANGTGDVALVLSGTFTVSDGAGNVGGGVITATAPGANFNLYDDGGTNTCQLQVAADGAVTVIRTAGSRTYAVNLTLNWL